jgi:hypothetical protein
MSLRSIFKNAKIGHCPDCGKAAGSSVLLECDHCGHVGHASGGHGCGIELKGGMNSSCPECHRGRMKRFEELYEDAS